MVDGIMVYVCVGGGGKKKVMNQVNYYHVHTKCTLNAHHLELNLIIQIYRIQIQIQINYANLLHPNADRMLIASHPD